MLTPVATRARIVDCPMPDEPPRKMATRGAVASLMSALEARISLSETMIGEVWSNSQWVWTVT